MPGLNLGGDVMKMEKKEKPVFDKCYVVEVRPSSNPREDFVYIRRDYSSGLREGGAGERREAVINPPSEDYDAEDFDDLCLTDEEITGKTAQEVKQELKEARRF